MATLGGVTEFSVKSWLYQAELLRCVVVAFALKLFWLCLCVLKAYLYFSISIVFGQWLLLLILLLLTQFCITTDESKVLNKYVDFITMLYKSAT